jgi:hypothetical protein
LHRRQSGGVSFCPELSLLLFFESSEMLKYSLKLIFFKIFAYRRKLSNRDIVTLQPKELKCGDHDCIEEGSIDFDPICD